ncbi:helix-turn-helix domain protein [Leadbetterella byssophila DSM 17132]|uniref:Helix-turn-helix domain protein n=1 Tax=Leadbetterella byssophila (strain DSM 17132 / JCM 16389 / KACC 11308 / NBRC 106382 / 4M15) TaxID=649349 RepID=E4RRK5_LEAB4|nr:helix-turn-helix domain protein [Leadbetterella byssophila DSM 17132]
MPSLKEKIEALIVGLDVSSTRFADLIGVKRPVISHILNGRNKPSLDIIQKIVERFPSLEYNWIGDDQDLDMDLVEEIRKNDLFYSSREFNGSDECSDDSQIFNSQAESKNKKKVVKVVFFYDDDTFKVFQPEAFA